jgi:ribokinase
MKGRYSIFIGDVALDEYYRIDSWPSHGTKVDIDPVGAYPGGMIANAAAVYAGYDHDTYFCWTISNTPTSDYLLAELADLGVDTHLVSRDAALDDSRNIIILSGDEHTVLTPRMGLSRIELSDHALAMMADAQYVYTAIGDLRMLRHRERKATDFLPEIRAGGVQLVLDLDVANLQAGDAALLAEVDILLVNRKGMETLAGDRGEPDVAAELLSGRLNTLVVTLAESGCRLYTENGVEEIPGVLVDTVDVTGAGDTFGAAFLHALGRTGDAGLSARFATAASARAVTIIGARSGISTVAEVMEFIQLHGQYPEDEVLSLAAALANEDPIEPDPPTKQEDNE